MKLVINSAESLSKAVQQLTRGFREKKYLTLSVRFGKDRSLDQNALWAAMYARISQMSDIGDFDDVRSYCKLHHGVRIMRRDDADFRAGWNKVFLHLDYETKLDLMGPCAMFGPDGFPVTRLFNRAQGVEYTERVAADFMARGVVLDDLLGGANE